MPDQIAIRPMRASDAGRVLAIYQAGLDAGEASFETRAPSWDVFDAAKLPAHRLIAADAGTGEVLGWAAVSPMSSRSVYAGVVRALIESTEAAGVWTIQSGIFPENRASLRLHERAGFRVVGIRERLGCHHGRWRDVVLVERRSHVAGPGPRWADPAG